MAKSPLPDEAFQTLLDEIRREHSQRKFDKLYYSKGFFSGVQAAALLTAFKSAPEKNKVIKILEPRLCRMSCSEAKEILVSFQVNELDRLNALQSVKRTLIDHHTTEGMEYILSVFEYERDKLAALGILQTVSTYVADQLAAGGHQGYAAMGGLYTQNWPLDVHLYGPLEEQLKRMTGEGTANADEMSASTTCKATSHPSYLYQAESCIPGSMDYKGQSSYPDPVSMQAPTFS